MVIFIIRRLLFILLNIAILSVVVFMISRALPNDPVDQLLSNDPDLLIDPVQYDQEYKALSHQLGYDLPHFYFSLGRMSSPDTLYKIPVSSRPFAQVLIRETGNWPAIQKFLSSINKLPPTHSNQILINNLYSAPDKESIKALAESHPSISSFYQQLINNKSKANHFIPRLSWHGSRNQFHGWITNILSGDFGLSIVDGRSSSKKIKEALAWTLILNLGAIVLIFLIGIWIGTWSAFTKNKTLKKVLHSITYLFFAIPIFWLATILIVFFTTDDYGSWTNWFAPVGLLNSCSTSNILTCFFTNFKYMILPLICLIIPSLAYLSRQMESSINDQRNKRYTLFLKSQGYSKKNIYYGYIVKNALSPIITLIGNAIPKLISGSLVIEIIFNIPGLGRLLYESIFANDWNVAFQLIFTSSVAIMLGYLLVDILYKIINPKINLLV